MMMKLKKATSHALHVAGATPAPAVFIMKSRVDSISAMLYVYT